MAVINVDAAGGPNVVAFLDMLAWSEIGPAMLSQSQDGYNLIVGSLPGRLITFNDYSDHPRKLITLNNHGIKSSAAGRYQFLSRTWDSIVRNYGFKGRFIPEAQDLAAIKLLKECGALSRIKEGRIADAIRKASPIWASLPGAGYGQLEHDMARLLDIYEEEMPLVERQSEVALVQCFRNMGGVAS
jgi:muramidase (phage lysozyme)